jgi:hypothetical protein
MILDSYFKIYHDNLFLKKTYKLKKNKKRMI